MFRNYASYNNYEPQNSYPQNGDPMNSMVTNSQPMQPQPLGTTPPLYPNFEPQKTSPFPHYNQMQAQYARGGRVGLGDMAERLRRHGEGEDKILAHINPEEAQFLGQNFGGDINPRTGLPQYGGIKKVFRSKLARRLLPIAGGIAGNFIGGPAGGTIGGALGTAITSKNPLKGALKGALISGGINYGLPYLAGHAGLGSVPGLGPQGLQGFGSQNAAFQGAGGFSSLFGGASGIGSGGGAGGISSILGGGGGQGAQGGTQGPGGAMGGIGNILLGSAVLGTLLGKKKPGKETGPSLDEVINKQNEKYKNETKYRPVKPYQRTLAQFDPNLYAAHMPEVDYFPDESSDVVYAAKGGYLDGDHGGQADTIPAKLSHGEYVIDASTVSDLGDGNNAAGAKKLDEMRKRIRMQKRTSGNKLPSKTKGLSHYLKGV
jgi:hypothetical protein